MGLRALSLTVGLATVAMLAGLGLLAPHMRGPGLLAAAIVAVNDRHIFFSQQARSYALYACIGLAMLGLFVWSERYASRRSFWFLAALVTITGALTHFWFAVYVAVLVLATRKAWCAEGVARGWRVVAALAAAAVAVWLGYVFPSTRPQENLASLAWVGTANLFGLAETVALSLGVLDIRGGTTLSFWTVLFLSVAGLVVPAVGPEAAWTARTQRTAWLFAALPIVSLFVLSVPPLDLHLFGYRHVLPSFAVMALLVSLGVYRLAALTANPRVTAACLAAFVLTLTGVPTATRLTHPRRMPYDRVASELRSARLHGLPVYATSKNVLGPVNYYLGFRTYTRYQLNERPVRDPGAVVWLDPAGAPSLPSRLALLVRSTASDEMAFLDRLRAGRHVEHVATYKADPRRPNGVELYVIEKRSLGGSGAP